MKTQLLSLVLLVVASIGANAQGLQYFRPLSQEGLNVFETPKTNDQVYDENFIKLGGDFSMIFQGLDQTNNADNLEKLSNNFQLPTANLNLDVQLEQGLRLHLRNYLSSRHHTEAYVKGGYLQMDNLDFVSEGLLSGFMEKATIKVGMDQFNYGDAHFRRSDNAMAIYNPFVGNYIMDAFSTEPFLELTYQSNGFLGVLGATNGRLNQKPTSGDNGFAYYAKVGYDKQLNDGLRVRLTGSIYNSSDQGTRDYLYGGDRAGSRYYMWGGDFGGRFNPRYPYQRAIQINPFVKAGGFEFFGVYEIMNNGDDNVTDDAGVSTIVLVPDDPNTPGNEEVTGVQSLTGGGYTQLGAELLYRFGATERLYVAFRYNKVSGEQYDKRFVDEVHDTSTTYDTQDITRINYGFGWFMTKNVLTKFEVVSQKYEGAWTGDYDGGEFNGFVMEAVITF